MVWTRSVWNNFKTQPEIWFFYAFLATSMLSVRKVVSDISTVGEFNEYTGTYLYLSDIFLVLAIVLWAIIILYNKLHILSINKPQAVPLHKESFTPVGKFHPDTNVPRGTSYGAGMEQFRFLPRGTAVTMLIPLVLVAWSFLSVIWSNNVSIALYRSFKLFEFCLLFLFLAFNLQCFTTIKKFPGQHTGIPGLNFLRNIIRIIIALGVINAIIGIIQVILQHSLGLFWLKESLISPDLPGIAKVVLGGTKYIRAYGLFPHPNILGGFLFLSILLTLAYRQLSHPRRNVPQGTSYGAGAEQPGPSFANKCVAWINRFCRIYSGNKISSTNKAGSSWNKFSYTGRHIIAVALIIQIVAGILTFSKSAILGLFLALLYMLWHGKVNMFHPSTNVPPKKECSPWNILRGRRGTTYGAGMKHFGLLGNEILKKALLIAATMGLGIYLIHPDFGSIFIKSMVERLVYIKISLNMIFGNFLAGIGVGQFILEMQKYSSQALLPWQFQPVHNVFLLIWSELGLIGFSIFVWFNWKLFHLKRNVSRLPRESQMFHVEHLSSLRGGKTGFQMDISIVLKALLMGFFFIALFDHYLWDIQQGQIMLWSALGLLAGSRLNT